jgi:hypothetical protein
MMGLDFETSPFNEQNIGVKNDHASSYTQILINKGSCG